MFLSVTTSVSAKVINYSDAYFVSMSNGQAATYENYTLMIHRTNLTDYECIIKENNNLVQQFTDHRVTEIIRDQNKQIHRLLQTLRVNRRHAPSLDFIGSALKFIAGTPDHADFDLLLTKEDMLVQNSNRQTNINSALQDKINELTERINELQRTYNMPNVIGEDELILLELIAARNGDVIFFLNQLALAITLAKANIVNPIILDNVEITHMLENEMVPLSVDNILKSSNISVFQNDNIILYTIKVPLINKFCKYLRVYPVVHEGSVIKLDINEAAQCDGHNIPVTNCIKAGDTNICKAASSDCLSHLLNNSTASSSTESSDNIPTIQPILEGVILLNNVHKTNITDASNIVIEGTAVVTFSNNITINGTTFYNSKQTSKLMELHPPKTLNMKKVGHETKLSLPYLHKIYLKNTDYLEALEDEIVSHKLALISFIITMPFITWAIIFSLRRKRVKPFNIEEIRAQITSRRRDAPIQRGGAVNSG